MAISLKSLSWRPIPFALLAGLLLRERGVPVDSHAANRSEALSQALTKQGMKVSGVTWLPGPMPWIPGAPRAARALVRGATKEDAATLHLVEAKLSPEGVLLEASAPQKLTKASSVEESSPAVNGSHVATALVAEGLVLGVQLVDLAGEPPPEGPTWTRLARAQNALTNYQETGQLAGIGRRVFRLIPPASNVSLRFEGGMLVVAGDGHEAKVPLVLGAGTVDADGPWLKPEPVEKGQVGNLVTWAVDRVRSMPWFGDDNMQRLKAAAFGALDVYTQAKSKVTTDTSEKEIAQEIGDLAASGTVGTFTDPETGWPPPKIEPYLKKPVPGEGEWIMLDHDPFIKTTPGAPPAFATTFVRTDKERPYTRINITVWDPRQVSLHPMGGAVEPVNATGTAGTGLIPRTAPVMKQVVGAFNGGFQALHGEFGMMAEGVVYLPPKPYAATVAELRDGSTAFGVWPNSSDMPADIVGFRQNLTPLVQDMKYNPYGRTWWGGTPPGWPDRVHTTRSGLCLTTEGFVAYFYGNGVDADVLGLAMIQARCKVGMHLDMNPGHTGLEFYSLNPKDSWPALGRAYQADWESEGEVSGIPGWRFRARRMTRGMGLMNFPRYIQREARDYFYLTLRPILPGADLLTPVSPNEAGEGKWRVKGLAQHGYPYAMATTLIRPDKSQPNLHVRLVKLDPHTLRPATGEERGDKGDKGEKTEKGGEGGEGQTVLVLQDVVSPRAGEPALWWKSDRFVISKQAVAGATALIGGGGEGAMLGVSDEDGMLLYAEVEAGSGPGDRAAIEQLLKSLGCTQRMGLEKPLSPLQGGATTMSGTPGKRHGRHEVRLVRAQAPGGKAIFTDTPIVPMAEWSPLQLRRIRYFKHAEKKEDDK